VSDAHNDIHAALDELGAPPGSTTAMRIRGLHRELTDTAASMLANARAGFDAAMADVVKERDGAIRQRDEQTLIRKRAETREAEALKALGRASHDADATERDRDAALREVRSLTHERDNCREVLRKEREERATEKATLGAALHTLRADTETLGESVERLNEENERLAAQLEFAERVLTAGIRRVVP
jgi:chromosome segregation ATPase